MIFRFSGENDGTSSSRSGGISVEIVRIVSEWGRMELSEEQIQGMADRLETPIRKMAHFMEYAVLSFCVHLHLLSLHLLRDGEIREKGKWWIRLPGKLLGIAMICCFLYACGDEVHQWFVPGRACRFFDVCVDTAGAGFGMVLFLTMPLQKVTMWITKERNDS